MTSQWRFELHVVYVIYSHTREKRERGRGREVENPINQNQFWDMWNNFNTKKPQALPIQNGDIWRAHFESLYKDIPINQMISDQCIIKEKLN